MDSTVAYARLLQVGSNQAWVIDDCPFCHQSHWHSAGKIGENPTQYLGSRSAQCGGGRGYQVIEKGAAKGRGVSS